MLALNLPPYTAPFPKETFKHLISHHTQAKSHNSPDPAEILGIKANTELALALWT